jgi:CHAT domain-containing protein
MSLARGFMYSGSGSVVMAMWEIEDRSGTEIVKGFYDNLRKGYSKSSSLRKVRIKYLSEADQLRSHPYFWSSLVVYGDNRPLYISKIYPVAGGTVAVLSLLIYLVYRRKRRYS